jgi:hypothetical protein
LSRLLCGNKCNTIEIIEYLVNVQFALKNRKNMRLGDAIWRRFKSDDMSAIFIALSFLTKWGEMLSVAG